MRRSPEQLQPELDEFKLVLGSWYRDRDSDSVRTQRRREADLNRVARTAETLVYAPQPSHRLVLTVGSEPVGAHTFTKGAYDFHSKYTYQARPGWGLAISRTEAFIESAARHVYLGGHVLVHITDIARTLSEDGSLQFMPVDEAPVLDLSELRD